MLQRGGMTVLVGGLGETGVVDVKVRGDHGVRVGSVLAVTEAVALLIPELRDMLGGEAAVVHCAAKAVVLADCGAALLVCTNTAGYFVLRALKVPTVVAAWAAHDKDVAAFDGTPAEALVLARAAAARVAQELVPMSPAPPKHGNGVLVKWAARLQEEFVASGVMFAARTDQGWALQESAFCASGFFSSPAAGVTETKRDASLGAWLAEGRSAESARKATVKARNVERARARSSASRSIQGYIDSRQQSVARRAAPSPAVQPPAFGSPPYRDFRDLADGDGGGALASSRGGSPRRSPAESEASLDQIEAKRLTNEQSLLDAGIPPSVAPGLAARGVRADALAELGLDIVLETAAEAFGGPLPALERGLVVRAVAAAVRAAEAARVAEAQDAGAGVLPRPAATWQPVAPQPTAAPLLPPSLGDRARAREAAADAAADAAREAADVAWAAEADEVERRATEAAAKRAEAARAGAAPAESYWAAAEREAAAAKAAAHAAAEAPSLSATGGAAPTGRGAAAPGSGAAVRNAVRQAGGDFAVLLSQVPDDELADVIDTLSLHVGVPQSAAAKRGNIHLSLHWVKQGVEEALARAGKQAAKELAATAVDDEVGRVMMIMARVAGPRARAFGQRTADDGEAETQRVVVERLADSDAASAAIDAAVRAGAKADDGGLRMRTMVRAAETNAEFGADVAFLLHQEKLEAVPKGSVPLQNPTVTVWENCARLHTMLAAARTRFYAKRVPRGVDCAAMVAGVNCGKVTLKMLEGSPVPGVKSTPPKVNLMRAWIPLLVMAIDVWPRDGTIPETLMAMAAAAFDIGRDSDACHGPALAEVFVEVTARMAGYRCAHGAGVEPTWGAAREQVLTDARERAAFVGVADSPPPSPAQSPLEKARAREAEEQKRAREAAATAAAVAAAAAADKDTPAPAEPGGAAAAAGGKKGKK